MPRKPASKRGGAPRKAPGGLDRVLFVRVDKALLDKLDNARRQRLRETPGVGCSLADLVRSILWKGLEA